MNICDLISAMESIAPTRYAESWDNVGLLVGSPDQPLTKALLTIDYTPAVAAEGARAGCDAVIAYHPPLFQPIKRIPADSVLHDAIRRNVAIYSPHTALDAADGGTNDVLADAIGLTDRIPLKAAEAKASQYKMIVFVPDDHVDRVSDALFRAGAGRIGRYSRCSFRSPGTGTFFGEAGANPAVGQAGRLELADEIRVETVVTLTKLEAVIAAMRQAHPYEEPAFDLVPLAAPPEARGVGRIGTAPKAMTCDQLVRRLKQRLGLKHLLVAAPPKNTPVRRVGLCAGAGGEFLSEAIRQGCDTYVTGEIRHHDALRAATAEGVTVVCTLHSNSERAALAPLADRLKERLPKLKTLISKTDRDPFSVI